MLVTKRDGSQEPIDLDKIHKVVEWACEGCDNVSVSDIELKAHLQFYNGIPTKDIQELLIKSAADLISVNTPDYQYVAAALLNFDLRKQVYGEFQPPKLYDFIVSMVERGLWDKDLLELYSKEDIEYFDSIIDHNNDFKFVYAAMVEWTGKYLVKNRTTKEIFETPQFAYIGISMALMQHEDISIRNGLVTTLYDELVSGRISLPTPIMGGVRTPTRQFSSCTVIDTDDSLDSINATAASIVKYVSQRAGIGVNVGKIRAVGSPIRKGEAEHTGLIPFIKHFQTAVKSCSQGGMRGGAATLTFPVWHYEVENLIVLKNNRGTDDNRARQLDYSVQFNKVMYERLLQDGDITLFSPGDVPDLYDAFYADTDKFKELYIKYENSDIRKKTVKASYLFSAILQERAQTGRIYIMNTDHMNEHSSFIDPIRMSNLCVTGDTKVLTKDYGYVQISELEGKELECWNGKNWSLTKLFRTSDGQEVMTVTLSNGQTIKATPYHKWYVAKQDGRGKLIGEEMKRTFELVEGDKLIKFDLEPVTHGTEELAFAYESGFHTADGTVYVNGRARISLYGDKQLLRYRFEGADSITEDNSGRLNINYKYGVLKDKYWIPDASYSIDSRISWLSGLLDGDGCLTNNNGTESLQLTSVEHEFILNLSLMLQELGVMSKVVKQADAGYRKLPANDGSGGYKMYWCKESYRILIPGSELAKLLKLGLNCDRVQPTDRKYNRSATQFIKVISVEDHNEVAPTFCGTEPKRNRLMFNGVLTGNCQEISLPTTPLKHSHDESGEIGLCTLAAFNLGAIDNFEQMQKSADILVRALDNLLDYQDYPVKAAEHAKGRRSLGIGITNFAYWLAKNGIYYSNGSANNAVHRLMEQFQYSLLRASNTLAKERGACAYFARTKYSKGILPIDTYKKDIDTICNQPLLLDWEGLRKDVLKFGVRNSTLSALMPCETSSKITNSTNGIEPPRGLVSTKGSKDGMYKQVVPDVSTLHYELLWDIPDNTGYLELVAIMQKFVDQSISANTNYDPAKFPNETVPMQILIKDLLTAYKLGIKTLYYHNTRDGADDDLDDGGCASGACKL